MGTIQTPCLSRRRLIIKIVAVILPNVLGRMDQERDVRLAIANIVDFYHWDYISIYGNREQKERLMQNVVIDALKGPRTKVGYSSPHSHRQSDGLVRVAFCFKLAYY